MIYRKIHIAFYSLLLIFCSCKKDNNNDNNIPANSIRDSRDGEIYSTVEIGGQIWLAENMRYNVQGSKLNPNNINLKYGRLYSWEQAKVACPSGWHLPSENEFRVLIDFVGQLGGAPKLRSETVVGNFRGTNTSGFSALPAGRYTTQYGNLGINTWLWTSTEGTMTSTALRTGLSLFLNSSDNDLSYPYAGRNPTEYVSCRCIKD
jgi:uncharacterized protein (TIGR02145 family)